MMKSNFEIDGVYKNASFDLKMTSEELKINKKPSRMSQENLLLKISNRSLFKDSIMTSAA